MTRRTHAALLSVLALILGAGALVLTGGGTASGADLDGTVTLTPDSGSLTDSPPWTRLTVSQGCPEHYRDALEVLIAFPSGDTADVVYGLTDGAPFDASPLTVRIPAASTDTTYVNSLADAFGGSPTGQPADGTYPIRVVCHAADSGAFPDTPGFTAFIEVTGDTWAAKTVTPPAATTLALTASPAGHAVVSHDVTLTATVSPAGAAGKVDFFRDGTVPVGSAPVSGGVATASFGAVAEASLKEFSASFVPEDATKFGSSGGTLTYAFTAEPSLTVLDATGDPLQDTPVLTPGQKITLTAEGFLPGSGTGAGESVHVRLDTGGAGLPDAASSVAGKVDNYAVELPDDLADGSHALVLKGATSGIEQSFAFTAGPDDDTSGGTDQGSTSGTDAGDTAGGGDSTAGSDSSGGSPGGSSDASGGSAGGSGTDGSTGGSSGGSSSGSGPLAATGAAGVVPLGMLAVLLIAAGAFIVHRVHRDGRRLGFGPPSGD